MAYRRYTKLFLERWAGFIESHHIAVIAAAALFTIGVLFYSISNFKINTDLSSMISEGLRFRQLEKEFNKAFPQLTDTMVVVIDADTVEGAMDARRRLAERLRKDTALFRGVYEPGGGSFFEKNGLLYLSVDELEKLSDNLAEAQPLIGILSQDYNLRGLFTLLEMTLEHSKTGPDKRAAFLLDRVSESFQSVARDRPYRLPWESMMLGEKEVAAQRTQFIIAQPYLESEDFSAGEKSIKAVRSAAAGLGLDKDVRVRITGDVALSYENYLTVMDSVGIATFASLVLVGIVLIIGLGSGRLVFASLATLIIGLVWTTGFAIASIGSLNLISVTFAVLFVGLGIDYSIQFCLRYRELLETGCSHREAVIATASGVGRGLFLSCITTAVGFYAFLPTAYAGVGELGLISGTGMFISFFTNLTVLPALLTLIKVRTDMIRSVGMPLIKFPYKYHKAVCIAALALGTGAAVLLPRVSFDYNPLNLYDRKSESIATIKELFENPEIPPWTISILANGKREAGDLAEKLGRLKEVKSAFTVSDFVPENQSEKLRIISDITLFMPRPGEINVKRLSYAEEIAALNGFEKALDKLQASQSGAANADIRKLLESVRNFRTLLKTPESGREAFSKLEKSLLSGLPALLLRLDASLHASRISETGLPSDIVKQYVSGDGRYRVQVIPRENILDIDALARFVNAVKSVAPDATDAPVTIYETGKAIISSFRLATLLALFGVVVVLIAELRNIRVTALILIPLILAILLTAAASVLFNMPLNYANVIVVPLLVGVGVHGGIMFMLRYLTEPPADGNMLGTSTARAVFFSTLTMMISTVTLAFSPHRGIAGMGALLTICFGFLLVSILVLLPALLKIWGRAGDAGTEELYKEERS